ncbi:BEL1-like homeodomain protein 1 [Henckelia pumila]|uniref:BEL1-like homeodomain protein 1 n=1 Tax=Henckelia pumila TaxID=405737 RepID=UPI003C6E0E75
MMGTYFHGNSEILGSGGDGLQTLVFMNPAYVGFSDNQPPAAANSSNFVFLNPSSSGNSLPFSHAPPSQTQHFVGVPLHSSESTAVAAAMSAQQQQPSVSALHGFFPGVHYNLYNQHMDIQEAREVSRSHQGLSLSLSSQQQPATIGYGCFKQEIREVPTQAAVLAAVSGTPRGGGDVKGSSGGSPSSNSGVSAAVNGVQSVLLSSKYLKVVQELLDEVANVGKGTENSRNESDKGANGQQETNGKSTAAAEDGQSGGESGAKRGSTELSTAERQEIQMKKAKLVNMLDEVEQRYRQYHHQMQIVISWFEQAAGIGSAKAYTAVALQTISKQFRCLKDSILGQIKSASKSLGEEDGFGDKMEGSRLKYVDNQIRQQRALQQLGMIQQNAWRPQRGLPERSVSVLRAWLFEHFLHPYPKDSDKIMLAKQTGLTRSQVSNWFINARVRLWKPMVEEMYLEEVKENEKIGSEDKQRKREQIHESVSKSSENSPGTKKPNKSIISSQETHQPLNQNIPSTMAMPTNSTSQSGANIRNQQVFNLVASSEMERITQLSPKKPRNPEIIDFASKTTDTGLMSFKFGAERQTRDGFTFMGAPTNFIGGFGSYPMGELERFGSDQSFHAPYSGNGVSLTLGLPHCESLPLSGSHQTYLPNQSMQIGRGVEIGEANFITSEY